MGRSEVFVSCLAVCRGRLRGLLAYSFLRVFTVRTGPAGSGCRRNCPGKKLRSDTVGAMSCWSFGRLSFFVPSQCERPLLVFVFVFVLLCLLLRARRTGCGCECKLSHQKIRSETGAVVSRCCVVLGHIFRRPSFFFRNVGDPCFLLFYYCKRKTTLFPSRLSPKKGLQH